MAFFRQTWTLVEKTLTVVFMRHWLGTLIRAFLAPIIFMFIISYTKNFFVPPSAFGIGSASPIRSFSDALASSAGGRDIVAFVDNGFTGGDISRVIEEVSRPVVAQGMRAPVLATQGELLQMCPSTIRGVSPCFGAIVFHSSPTEGPDGRWNYTMRSDGSLGTRIFVNQENNDVDIYALPLQHAVDAAIATANGTTLRDDVQQYPFTTRNEEERDRNITRLYMGTLISILGLAYFIGICGICYQLTGHMAEERELGMSQLIEAMMPNKKRWMPQAARLLSLHISFDILYFPSWVIMGAIVGALNYPTSNIGIPIGYFIISGLALSSWSIAFAALFRKSQLSGITVTMTAVILAIVIQVIPPPSTGGAIIASLLMPSMNFTLYIIYNAYWERVNLAADLRYAAPDAPWRVPGYVLFLFCAIQFLVYPFIGALIERSLYGTASKSRELRYSESEAPETLKITGLTKHYSPGWFVRNVMTRFSKKPLNVVRAVDSIDLSVLKGQIMVLLGANGSGKSTTLDMLAGLQKPTSGRIEMDGTGGIGLCPQKNVLWDELTVYEHVRIFNRLKSETNDSKAEMEALVASCDLEQKIHARSETLSGGQKRKCQLAMMLTGGSSLCMLDEVSSGLDPLSRRKIWDILLAERGKRSMVLTTHFLDEADLLSDDISILSKGKMVAHGSAVELKHNLGGGYRVRIYKANEKALPEELEATSKQVYHDQTVYFLADSAAASQFIVELERHGVRDYQVNGPQIEDCFLKLAEEVKEELDKDRAPSPTPSTGDAVDSSHEADKGLRLLPGRPLSFFGQTWVLFRKRAVILRRNAWPYLAALIIPIITAALVTLFIKSFEPLTCDPTTLFADPEPDSFETWLAYKALIPTGPTGQFPTDSLQRLYPALGINDTLRHEQPTLQAFNEFVAARYHNVTPGGVFLGNTPTIAYRGDYGMQYAVSMQNLMDNSLLGFPIVTAFQAFAREWAPDAGQTLQFILYFGLAMSVFPGFFSLYTNVERLRNVRALHYSNGVRAGPLWLAYTCFDFIIVLLVSAVAIIIFTASSGIFYGPGYLFLVFALFGLSATLMSYVVSLFTTSQLATFAFAAGGQCIFFLLYFIAFMAIITYAPPANIDSYISIANWTIALFFPSGNLLRALLLSFNEFSLLCKGNNQIAPYPGAIDVYGGPILYLIIQSVVFMTVLIAFDSGWRPGFLARSRHRSPDSEETDDVDNAVFSEALRMEDSKDELRVNHVTKAFGSNVAVQDVSFGVPHGDTFALLGPNGAGKSTTIGLIRGDMRPSSRESDILIEDISIIDRRAAARSHLGVCPQFDAMDQMTAIEHLRFYARARGVKDVEYNVDQVIHAVGLAQFKDRLAGKLSGGNKRKLSLGIALMGNPSVLLLDEPSSGMDAASKRVMWRTLRAVSEGRSLVLTTHSMEEADALADRAGIMAKRMLALGTSDELRKKHGDAHHVHLVHKDAPYSTDEDMNEIKSFIKNTFPGATTEERTFHGQLRFSVPNDRTAHHDVEKLKTEIVLDDDKKIAPSTPSTPEHSPTGSNSISALFAQLEHNKEKLGFEYYSVSQATLDQVFLSIVTKHNVLEENYAREHQKTLGPWDKFKRGVGKVYHNA